MKRLISLLAALALCLCLIIPAGAADALSAGLKFKDPEGTFKIIHVTDTQEFILSSTITQEFLYDLAEKEKPDLFVLTGDNTSTGGAANFPKPIAYLLVKSGVDSLMCVFDRIYKDFDIPVTMVFGNHDNEAGPDKVTRAEQFAMYAAHPSFFGYYIEDADKGSGTNDVQGDHYGTHNLVVKNKAGTANAFNIWMFDSGSYDPRGGYSCVQPQQIAWFERTNAELGYLPSFAFQHIIVPEIKTFVPDGVLPTGTQGQLNEGFGSGKYNEGQYAALNGARNVLAMFFGHDHLNTFVLRRGADTDLVNSPSTGFGSYGEAALRGARIITLHEDMTYETEVAFYQDFYGPNPLRQTRLEMFQSMSTPAIFLDIFSFKPLLWLLGLFLN